MKNHFVVFLVCVGLAIPVGGLAWHLVQKDRKPVAEKPEPEPEFSMEDRPIRCLAYGEELLIRRLDCLNEGGTVIESEAGSKSFSYASTKAPDKKTRRQKKRRR